MNTDIIGVHHYREDPRPERLWDFREARSPVYLFVSFDKGGMGLGDQ